MALQTQHRSANPRLGIYFSILASIVIGLFFFLLIVEQLGADKDVVRLLMVGGPVALFALIAVLAFSLDVSDFFVVGRRVPSFFGGLGLAITVIGSVGTLSITGLFFHGGFDGLAMLLGMMVGLVLLGLLVAPYYRKFGAYTVSGYLGGRFDSRLVRIVSALVLVVPCFLFVMAEIEVGAKLLNMITGRGMDIAVASFVMALIFMVIWGGMRGLIWTNSAQGIVSFMVLMVVPMIAAILLTNLPLPQITYGTLLDDLGRLEVKNGVTAMAEGQRDFGRFLSNDIRAIATPFMKSFGTIDSIDFLLIILTVIAGICAAPHLLIRMGATPGVSENRKTLGWACLVLGLVLLTLPAIAVFTRYLILERWVGVAGDQVAPLVDMLVQAGFLDLGSVAGRLEVQDIKLTGDGALLVFPVVMGLPEIFFYLIISCLVALALAAASAQLLTLSTLFTVDVGYIGDNEGQHSVLQTVGVRVVLIVAGVVAGWLVLRGSIDPFSLFFLGLQFSAAAGFPVLVLSIWWKRINYIGALAAIVAGTGVAGSYSIAVWSGLIDPVFGVDPRLSAIFAVPAGFITGMIVALFTPAPSEAEIDLVRDMRMPGGETLYDRTMRYGRLREQRKKSQI